MPMPRISNGACGPLMVALLGLFCHEVCFAGSDTGSERGVERFGEDAIRAFSRSVNQTLFDRGVRTAIIGRCGRERSDLPAGMRYTHCGIVVLEPVLSPDGRVHQTYSVYGLFHGRDGSRADGDETTAYLAHEFMYQFVSGMVEPDVAVVVPIPEVQDRLAQTLRTSASRLYQKEYSLFANPHDPRYDNCNTFILKVLFSAIYQTEDLDRIQRNIVAHYRPQPIELSLLQHLAVEFIDTVRLNDKGPRGFQTVTFTGLSGFLGDNGLRLDEFVVSMHPEA